MMLKVFSTPAAEIFMIYIQFLALRIDSVFALVQ
jgi:hypothetical protein